MPEYVDSLILRVDNVDLDDVIVELNDTTDVSSTPVNTMNRRRVARGYKQKNTNFTLELKVEQIDDPRVPDWHVLAASRKRFTIVKTPNVGSVITYMKCIATKVADTTSAGDSSRSVSVLALERKSS
jgi:hypothetical protein